MIIQYSMPTSNLKQLYKIPVPYLIITFAKSWNYFNVTIVATITICTRPEVMICTVIAITTSFTKSVSCLGKLAKRQRRKFSVFQVKLLHAHLRSVYHTPWRLHISQCPFNCWTSGRQAGKLWIPILESLTWSNQQSNQNLVFSVAHALTTRPLIEYLSVTIRITHQT